MGSLLATFSPVELFTDNDFREIFFIRYLGLRGPTQYNWDLIPGGGLKPSDDGAVARHKFKMALKKQSMLSKMIHDRNVTRGLSPCLYTDFSLEGSLEKSENMYTYTYNDGVEQVSKSKSRSRIRPTSRPKLGNLDHIVSAIYPAMESVEEIAAYETVKQPVRGSEKERRARSRPEWTSKAGAAAMMQRQALSVTEVRNDSLPPIQEAASQKIELGGKRWQKACWPPKDNLRNVLKDPKNRPTNYLFGRFRHLQEEVEVEFRFNKSTEEESFEYKGNLELLLPEEGRHKYQIDKLNKNLDEKAIFFESLPYFFNNYEARIFWNGFLMCTEGPLNQRMSLRAVGVDPPTLIFDMSGLSHISASRNHSKLNITGDNDGGDGASKSFSIRGRSETDVKRVEIQHADGTVYVSVRLPPLSTSVSTRPSHENVFAEQ